jgi:hypothetical protein
MGPAVIAHRRPEKVWNVMGIAYAAASGNENSPCKDKLPRLGLEQRRCLPYGVYFTWDGQAVLFDRRYRPIYRRWPDGRVERDDPGRRVHGIRALAWLYDDNCSPRTSRETLRRVLAIQQRWYLPCLALRQEESCSDIGWLMPPEWMVNRTTRKAAA